MIENTDRRDKEMKFNYSGKRCIQGISTAALLLTSSSAYSSTIIDNYIGSDAHHYGDVIGATSDFDINSMQVTISGSTLNVSIDTNFAGKADDGLFTNATNGLGIGYGDLFLSSSWTPNGNAPYETDNASNGTVWEYGFSLSNRWMSENDNGTGTLYKLASGDNHADILMSDNFIDSAFDFRNGQEVAVNTASANVSSVGSGTWDIDAANNLINFQIDLAGTNLLFGDEIALHWGATCANDTIEGVAPVPVPAAVWLFASGMIGLFGVARRKAVA